MSRRAIALLKVVHLAFVVRGSFFEGEDFGAGLPLLVYIFLILILGG
ncbi:hypothetical protein H6G27_02100 [Nostoc linckia FACHB-104]|nr:hypothetical protein [Nostoc linckia FACHB-104]